MAAVWPWQPYVVCIDHQERVHPWLTGPTLDHLVAQERGNLARLQRLGTLSVTIGTSQLQQRLRVGLPPAQAGRPSQDLRGVGRHPHGDRRVDAAPRVIPGRPMVEEPNTEVLNRPF